MKIEVDSCIHGEKPCPLYSFEDCQCVRVQSDDWAPPPVGVSGSCPLKNGPITISLVKRNGK